MRLDRHADAVIFGWVFVLGDSLNRDVVLGTIRIFSTDGAQETKCHWFIGRKEATIICPELKLHQITKVVYLLISRRTFQYPKLSLE